MMFINDARHEGATPFRYSSIVCSTSVGNHRHIAKTDVESYRPVHCILPLAETLTTPIPPDLCGSCAIFRSTDGLLVDVGIGVASVVVA